MARRNRRPLRPKLERMLKLQKKENSKKIKPGKLVKKRKL
jgi:hypothetical protein